MLSKEISPTSSIRCIDRDKDVILSNEDLEELYSFKEFPVFMGCASKPKEEDLFFDMRWNISKKSGAIQLNPLLPLDIVYMFDHGSGTTGKVWAAHHNQFALFISKYSPKNVLEIGGGHGTLANTCTKNIKNVKWLIVDPNPKAEQSEQISVKKCFFDDRFIISNDTDTIVHSHLLEHIYYPDLFFQQISNHSKIGNQLIFSVPNLQEMLKKNYTNCLNFEHTIFITEPYIEYFLFKYGFSIIEKSYFKEDHSIFYSCRKMDKASFDSNFSGLYEFNKGLFLKHIQFYQNYVNEINEQLNKSLNKAYLFGAHIFSQYLIAFGLNQSKIECIIDNDKNKQGKRLYGTDLSILDPSCLSYEESPLVILRAGIYNDEIKLNILNDINNKAIFL
jgi:hypothetical protein